MPREIIWLTLVGLHSKAQDVRLPSNPQGPCNANLSVALYKGTDGLEYAKCFYAVNRWPEVPTGGTHEMLNEMKEQIEISP